MPDYDGDSFQPPAPLAKVTLRYQVSGATVVDVAMLIDSGADVSLVPKVSVDQLGLSLDPEDQFELMSFDGNRSTAQAVNLDLIFLRRIFRGRYVITDDEIGILGRDVLNHVTLLLDGPAQYWSEQRSI